MSHDDPHSLSFNLSSSVGSTNWIPILFPNDYEVWALHFEDYVLGIDDIGSSIWHSITEGTYEHTETKKVVKTLSNYHKVVADHANIMVDKKNKLMSNVKAMRIIRFALQPDTIGLVNSYDTAKGIWDRLKELYSGDADLEHSVQTLHLSEFGAFSQKSDETLDQAFNRYNHLLSRMLKYNLERKVIEPKLTSVNGLRSEWGSIVNTVKAHEQFKIYSLAKLVGIIRSLEDKVMKINTVASLGNLALVAKGKKISEESESDISDEELTKEVKALMVSNPKKFFNKNISRFRNNNNNSQRSSYTEKPKSEGFRNSKVEEEKEVQTEDSGYDCHYCLGKNHLASDCMLRKMHEKKGKVKDED